MKPEKDNEEESYLDSLLRSRSPLDATEDASKEKVGSWLLKSYYNCSCYNTVPCMDFSLDNRDIWNVSGLISGLNSWVSWLKGEFESLCIKLLKFYEDLNQHAKISRSELLRTSFLQRRTIRLPHTEDPTRA